MCVEVNKQKKYSIYVDCSLIYLFANVKFLFDINLPKHTKKNITLRTLMITQYTLTYM